MRKADRISGVFWLLFSVLVTIESYRLGLGTLIRPGPGFLFFWGSIILGIMSLIVLIKAWTNRIGAEEVIFSGQNRLKILLIMISVFLYALFMEEIGFIPLTLMLFIFLLGVIEKKKWHLTLFISLVVTGISYLIFEVWLRSQLPKGLLGILRF